MPFAVIIGPATAAHTKILKNFIMEKPTFLAHEFFHTFRTEFKHACIVGVLDCVLACCISAAFYVYPRLIEQTGSKMFYVLFAITLSIGVIALLMNFYIFPMLVSTNLSLKNVLEKFAGTVDSCPENQHHHHIGIGSSHCGLRAGADVREYPQFHDPAVSWPPVMPVLPGWGLVITFQSYPVIQK